MKACCFLLSHVFFPVYLAVPSPLFSGFSLVIQQKLIKHFFRNGVSMLASLTTGHEGLPTKIYKHSEVQCGFPLLKTLISPSPWLYNFSESEVSEKPLANIPSTHSIRRDTETSVLKSLNMSVNVSKQMLRVVMKEGTVVFLPWNITLA